MLNPAIKINFGKFEPIRKYNDFSRINYNQQAWTAEIGSDD